MRQFNLEECESALEVVAARTLCEIESYSEAIKDDRLQKAIKRSLVPAFDEMERRGIIEKRKLR
jgi:hypothetical protein